MGSPGEPSPEPVGIARDLLAALVSYTKIAWWGVVSPRVERKSLVVLQGVIVSDDGVLLAVREDLRGWELPGGTLEEGESHAAALRREVREETGLDVEIDRHVGDYVRTGFRPHVAKVYRCHAAGGELRAQPGETRDLRWFRPDALPSTLFPWYRQPLADALGEARASVTVEEHQGVDAILTGLAIDLRMRFTRDSGGS